MKKPTRWILLLAALGVAFCAGLWKGGRPVGEAGAGRKALYWVDPMNPSFRSPTPGTAPCGMPLAPVYEGARPGASPSEAGLSAGTVRVSPERLQLIGVRVAAVERMPATRTVRLLGRVTPDETRVYRVVTFWGLALGAALWVAPAAALGAQPRLVLGETHHNFGEVFEDRQLSHTFDQKPGKRPPGDSPCGPGLRLHRAQIR